MKSLLPEKVRIFIRNSYLFRKISLNVFNGVILKKRLIKNLSNIDDVIATTDYRGEKVLVPLFI